MCLLVMDNIKHALNGVSHQSMWHKARLISYCASIDYQIKLVCQYCSKKLVVQLASRSLHFEVFLNMKYKYLPFFLSTCGTLPIQSTTNMYYHTEVVKRCLKVFPCPLIPYH